MTGVPVVRTVLGDVAPAALGRTDAHEHLFIVSPDIPGEEIVDVDDVADELALVRASGIDAVVDLTTLALGRQPAATAEASRRSGVHVVLATGYHHDGHYRDGHWVHTASHDVLRDAVVADLVDGIRSGDDDGERTAVRAGIVKAAASYHRISATERHRLEACVEAARATGAALAVHCEIGTFADDVLDIAAAGGLPPGRVVLAHLDRNPDPDVHEELARRGAHLVYDTVGRIKYRPDVVLLDLVEAMVERGVADRLLLGTDLARRTMLRSRGGGPGMDVLGRTFVPRLVRRLGAEAVDAILRANPARVLASSFSTA